MGMFDEVTVEMPNDLDIEPSRIWQTKDLVTDGQPEVRRFRVAEDGRFQIFTADNWNDCDIDLLDPPRACDGRATLYLDPLGIVVLTFEGSVCVLIEYGCDADDRMDKLAAQSPVWRRKRVRALIRHLKAELDEIDKHRLTAEAIAAELEQMIEEGPTQ